MNIENKNFKSPYNRKRPTKHQVKARYIASFVRNSEIENLHGGMSPSSKTGDFTDVKVVTPFGEIPWNELSRISDDEMRKLMFDIETNIIRSLKSMEVYEGKYGEKILIKELKDRLRMSATWDRDMEYLDKLTFSPPSDSE